MQETFGPPAGPGPEILQIALTLSMLRNLVVIFEATEEHDALLVEQDERGLWATTADGQRIYVGTAASRRL